MSITVLYLWNVFFKQNTKKKPIFIYILLTKISRGWWKMELYWGGACLTSLLKRERRKRREHVYIAGEQTNHVLENWSSWQQPIQSFQTYFIPAQNKFANMWLARRCYPSSTPDLEPVSPISLRWLETVNKKWNWSQISTIVY